MTDEQPFNIRLPTVTERLRDSRQLWDRHAAADPLWAILTDPAKTDRRWNVARFLQTGSSEITTLLYELGCLMEVRREAALDFGCGVGRLTQALAPHFARVVGVDISPRMIAIANSLNRFSDRVTYVTNLSPELAPVAGQAFDLIVTRITLQHIPPDLTLQYIAGLCGRLATGGAFVFQVPSHARTGADDLSDVRPMPADAYDAAIVFENVKDGNLTPGGRITLNLSITNNGPVEWSQPAFGRMTVGNHWLDGTGHRMLVRDDGRTGIPERMGPGETCRVPLSLTLPREPGAYQCEVDLSHEGVLWFQDRGSPTERVLVTVGSETVVVAESRQAERTAPPARHLSGDDAALVSGITDGEVEPFPMYGISRDVVMETVERCGADVVEVHDDTSCGSEWVSYQYFARRR
jgi:SAM-dependent methyltransferase